MKNYIISVGLLCLGMAVKAQVASTPKVNPLSTITEIKPGSVLNKIHKNQKFNILQSLPKVVTSEPSAVSLPELAYRIQSSTLDGMPLILPNLQGLAPMPIAKPSESFRSEMPIKDFPSQYR